MANAREIKSRISSVQDTMKITNAMYMISSSKMKKAKKILSDTEPYFYNMQSAIARILRLSPLRTHCNAITLAKALDFMEPCEPHTAIFRFSLESTGRLNIFPLDNSLPKIIPFICSIPRSACSISFCYCVPINPAVP